MKVNYPHQTLFEVPFFDGSVDEVLRYFRQHFVKKTHLLTVSTPNPEQIVQASQDQEFQRTLQSFDIFLPDGTGIVWASRILDRPLQSRIAGVDVVEQLLKVATELKLKVLLVGGQRLGERGQSDTLQFQTSDLNPQVIYVKKVAIEWVSGYQNIKTMSKEALRISDEQVARVIAKSKPDIVLVAFGAPYQEAWVVRNHAVLEKNKVAMAMVVGGALDFLTGKVSRAPKWVQQTGFEWLYRLKQEPWRWKRQLRLISFAGLVGKEIYR